MPYAYVYESSFINSARDVIIYTKIVPPINTTFESIDNWIILVPNDKSELVLGFEKRMKVELKGAGVASC